MGAGKYGNFGRTRGSSGYVAGDASFMGATEQFLKNIRKRRDVDPDGKFDLIAHGTASYVQFEHNGKTVNINSRTVAKLIKQMPGYKKGQPIRLLSCNTGTSSASFAQNLANKLNVSVWAPNKYLWADDSGNHFVAGMTKDGKPNRSDKGKFVEYKPGGNKK